MLKMFVNYIIKPYMFRPQFFNRLQGTFFRALYCYYFSACLRRQVVYLVCGCMLSMCVRA